MNIHHKTTMDEIVFENRNKAYGAYALRKETHKNEQRGLFLSLILFVLVMFVGKNIASSFFKKEPLVANMGREVVIDVKEVDDVTYERPKPEIKTEIPKELPQTDVPQDIVPITPQQNTQAFEEMKAVEDNKAQNQDLAKQSDLVDKIVSSTTTLKEPDMVAMVTTSTTVNSTPMPNYTTPQRPVNVAEVMPSFPGGTNALLAYLKKEMSNYVFSDNEQDGKIFIRFYVDIDGSIKETTILKDDVGGYFGKRALSVINKMPRWSPGMQGNKAVKVYYTLPMTYKQVGI